ncbi:MAG: SUMF1/EgtB/PvdO family nonheme iron enzyme [Bryobacteraceae bacterium]
MRVLALALAPLCALAAVDFKRDVAPLLEQTCVGCHGPAKADGGLRVDSPERIRSAITPRQPDRSGLYLRAAVPVGKPGAMPPGGPGLTREQLAVLRQWIAEGAVWPAGVTLALPKKGAKDTLDLTSRTRTKLLLSEKDEFKAYKQTIPGTDVSYEMAPIPGGEFLMGTPEGEPGRKKDEGPQRRVKLEPFWMAKFEVTWDEYRLFMFPKDPKDELVDGVSRPTRPYVEMSFGMGLNGFPAISMTQHAANKYAQWLSARTGHFYRLPTEAEWEYACRAGSDAAYSFGAEESKLGEYAWYVENSNGKYQKVGTKKPNAWGLHDMHGNVMEWTLDQYAADFYAKAGPLLWLRATKPYPQAVRGGSWNDDAAQLRCGARVASDASWKMQDPQLPKSIWYHTDAQWLGFRLVRPVKVPPAAEMHAYWNSGVEGE